MNEQEVKKAIEAALRTFPNQPLAEAASHVFEVLGYTSQRRLKLSPNNRDTFVATFDQGKTLNDQHALPGSWRSIDFLFQLTDDEIRAAGHQQFLLESQGTYNGAVINSFLFFALELQGNRYTRTALAGITRELNKLFDKPVLVLFRHGETLTLAVSTAARTNAMKASTSSKRSASSMTSSAAIPIAPTSKFSTTFP